MTDHIPTDIYRQCVAIAKSYYTMLRRRREQEEIILRPSYQSVYVVENGETQIREADLEAVLAWKSGKFVARNDRLEDILRKLGRWYDFQVVYTDPRLRDLCFHIHCERYENVMDILERVEETYGIHFSEYNGTIYVSR